MGIQGQRQKCWVVCRMLGVTSEVWLYRQIKALQRFMPEVVCWGYSNERQFPADSFSVHLMPFEVSPSDGDDRWRIRVRNLGQVNFYGSVGAEALALQERLDEFAPTVILAQFGHFALRILPIGLRSGVPVVAHFHGIDISAGLRNRWYRTSLRWNIHKFAAMVVVAEYQRAQLVALGADPNKIHVIPCGVPIGELPAALDVGGGPCRFLSVGRFTEKKGPLLVIRAFAHCVPHAPEAKLTMIGDGPLLEQARELVAEFGIADRVRFTGAVPSSAVLEEMSQSSVFLQHSMASRSGDMEGWPVSIAEAMGVGLPVVATRHAGITEQVVEGESGFLVAEGVWEEMGRRMAQLSGNRTLRKAMGKYSAEVARMRFCQCNMVSRLEAVLASVSRPGRALAKPATLARI